MTHSLNLGPGKIMTTSGVIVDLNNPTPGMIHIEDIAHSLARQCRFGGHLNGFFSVAQHSCAVSFLLFAKGMDEDIQFAGLMHDASEAYLLDMPSPIKAILPEYKAIEQNLMKVIVEKFQFQYPLPEAVHEADRQSLIEENNRYRSSVTYPDLHLYEKEFPGFAAVEAQFLSEFMWYRREK